MRRSGAFGWVLVFAALGWMGCDSNDDGGGDDPQPREVADGDYTTTPTGLRYFDFVTGEGVEADTNHVITAHYIGWLTDGRIFDTSLGGLPIQFRLGTGRVIAGWDEGLVGMRVGGERQLVIPPSLGYGSRGTGNIPPNATLIFEVSLGVVDTTAMGLP